MGLVREFRDDIVVAGWSCKLPGANSISELWSLLREGRCAVSQVPEDRFSLQRYLHPRRQERGKSYTFRAGVVDNIFGFDPTIFGISPREAEQMDPQQRLLLQLTWEALEDAGIRPSAIAGEEVGVFVGGSLTDYSHSFIIDQAVGDAYFATGNALAALSNRISYCFNLKGPSLTVDTACSSSLVALNQAVNEIRSGRIDTAIVAGINVIGSPMSFITFSQASMLSPTGLCHAFDAEADGFVRAEGGVVLVLRKASVAKMDRNPVRGIIVAADVNSDGRTGGMALPSWEAQHDLLNRVYARAGVNPSSLAFVEAHGTGTAVGDPAEARALGQGLGQKRGEALVIGSIKTNIGHLEPAAGLTGLLKALLALNHEVLPASLHFKNPNPHIDFAKLNLTVCDRPMPLPGARGQFAGVNSFGFGGTNAHVIVAAGTREGEAVSPAAQAAPGRVFTISAETKQALAELAGKYVGHVETLREDESATVAAAAAWRRENLRHRLVISGTGQDEILSALRAHGAGDDHPLLTTGQASGDGLATALVFSGNGGQRTGMGIAAYQASADFRAGFDSIDGYFQALAGWSLKDAMFDPALGEKLHLTSVAQPLIFAIQSAMAGVLRARGIVPAAVLGHSVGEVAAAEAAGIIDTQTATRIIYYRSKHQERTHDTGGMTVLGGPAELAAELLAPIAGVELAAHNSPRAVTVAGSKAGLQALKRAAQLRGIAFIDLNLNYPFHTSLMAPIKDLLIQDLAGLAPVQGTMPFISTVTGAQLRFSDLGADYWWHNVRQPVRFSEAIAAAAKLGIRTFIEVSPNSVLTKHITDCLIGETQEHVVLACPDARDGDAQPFDRVVARALIAGATIDEPALFGPDPGGAVPLPHYPWQKTPYRYKPTVEAVDVVEKNRHRLSGVRAGIDALEWHSHIDTALIPEFADHQVGNRVLFPGTGFLEIGLSVAAQVLGTERVNLRNIEILRPLDLSFGKTHEVQVRLSPAANIIEILSRPRLSAAGWTLNCRCKMFRAEMSEPVEVISAKGAERPLPGDALYRIAQSCGLNYGPSFRLGAHLGFHDDNVIAIELEPKRDADMGRTNYLLDPVRTDACVQGFIATLPELKAAERGVAYVPVRVDDILLLKPGGTPQRAVMKIRRKSEHSIFADTDILAEDGSLIASLRGIRFQALPVRRLESVEAVGLLASLALADRSVLGESESVPGADAVLAAAKLLTLNPIPQETDAIRLQEKWALSAAYEIAGGLARGRTLDLEQIANEKRLPSERMAWLVYLLRALEKRELVTQKNGVWEIHKASLPSSGILLKQFIADYPQRAAEILVMSELSAFAARVKDHGAGRGEPVISGAALEFLHSAMAETADREEPLWTLLKQNVFAADRATRVLQIGAGPITQNLLAASVEIRLTVLEPQESRLDRAQLSVPRRGDVVFMGDLTQGSFDLVIAADGLDRLPASITLNRLRDFVAPGGMLVGITGKSRLFHDLVFGAERSRPAPGDATEEVMLRAELEGAGFTGVKICPLHSGAEETALFIATQTSAPAAEKPAAEQIRFHVLAVNDPWARSIRARLLQDKGAEQEGWQPAPADNIVQILGGGEPGDADTLAAQCLTLRDLAQQAEKSSLIVLIFCDALGVHPVSAGLWAFARTLANEFPGLEFKRIDIAAGVPPAWAAQQIARLLNAHTAESELRIEKDALRVVRVDSIRRRQQLESQTQTQAKNGRSRGQAARLELSQLPGGRVEWKACKRTAPKADEIEIAVEATGLNFRDLMWSLRLLPDDILEDGCTGPTLGLECAGKVVRVGADVEKFEVGDPVVAMTGNAFSTHMTLCETRVEKLPSGLSFEAAATIPVTFLTAYYSLVTLANLKAGEWVLVHGGAGGVGLAAIQVAKSLGAKVIATAGSGAKRELLKRMGADHVLESRSTGFVEGVRKLTKTGADVVLNSLAQDAMEQSLACLAPFGRFVELGKRDYVADTQIGVRVFRKNASYFGVDVDQLMARGDLGSQLLKRIMKEFRKGAFKPLLHTVFAAADVGQAFGLMQQSAHVGKIIVRPPTAKAIPLGQKAFQVDRNGTHLVTGAFRGLGLETAKWLVERGARNLVLLSRSGPVSEEAQAALEDFSQRGVKLLWEKCDVADRGELEMVFARAKEQLPPIVGIIHSAMVLDDGLIANLDESRFRTVLAPKVTGARNLDSLSRDLALEYFVLFSSVTTLMGNPGQGNYVAANAFLEGLARRRRGEGLPALAIGWGPITDVGVVARSEKLKLGLKRLTGARGMTSQEALALMVQALELSNDDPALAVMTIAPNDGSFGDDRLKVLRSPTYAPVLRARGTSQEAAAEAVDILALAKTAEAGVVARKVGDLIVEHLSRVLHAREDVINRTRPLGEIGLDSLMAVELAMNLEEIFGVTVALAGSSASLTVVALAEKIVSQIMGSAGSETSDPIPVLLAPVVPAGDGPARPANDVGLPGARNAPEQKLPAE